jgi:hypothetical protein
MYQNYKVDKSWLVGTRFSASRIISNFSTTQTAKSIPRAADLGAGLDLCLFENTRLSLGFTLRRKRRDDFQGIDIDQLNHSRRPHQRRLAPLNDHSRKVPLRLLSSQETQFSCHCSHSLIAETSTKHHSNVLSSKFKVSRYQPIFHFPGSFGVA